MLASSSNRSDGVTKFYWCDEHEQTMALHWYDGNDDDNDDAFYAVHRYPSMDFMCINECDCVNVMNLMSDAHCSRPIPSRTFCEILLAMYCS